MIETQTFFYKQFLFEKQTDIEKVKQQQYWTPRKIQNMISVINSQNQKLKHIKRMEKNV